MDATENFVPRELLPPVRPGQNDLSETETRVLGCLLEKQRTTPDQYPLTLNGLRLACNQATNRDPVVDYDDTQIRDALHRLERRGFVRLASGRGSRAPKYRHLLSDALPMGADETAVMCVLMLRGAQTPGELKQRTERIHLFAGLAAVAQTLERLIARDLAQRLERRPGQKEERFRELLTGDGDEGAPLREGASPAADAGLDAGEAQSPQIEPEIPLETAASAAVGGVLTADFEELRARVERLERELDALRGARAREDRRVSEPAGEWEVN